MGDGDDGVGKRPRGAPAATSPPARRAAGGAPGRRTLTQGLVRRSAQRPAPSQGEIAAEAVDGKDSGAALSGDVRQAVEPVLGVDLGAARVHSGPEAQEAAAGLGARAFAAGPDIFLGAGETASDTRLMAHELTHVAQQAGTAHHAFSVA